MSIYEQVLRIVFLSASAAMLATAVIALLILVGVSICDARKHKKKEE